MSNGRARAIDRTADRAFLDSMTFIRDQVQKGGTDGPALSMLALPLRRLLCDGDINRSAGPRALRVRYSMPANAAYTPERLRAEGLEFWQSACVSAFGIEFGAIMVESTTTGIPFAPPVRGDDPDAREVARISEFLEAPVIYFRGFTIRRRHVIQYMANRAGVAHLGGKRGGAREFDVLDEARAALVIQRDQRSVGVLMNVAAFERLPTSPAWGPDRLDVALVELLAAAAHFVNSPDVVRLEHEVRTSTRQTRERREASMARARELRGRRTVWSKSTHRPYAARARAPSGIARIGFE